MARPFRWGNGRMREEKNAKAKLDTPQKAPSKSPRRLVDAWLEEAGRVRSCGGGLMVGEMVRIPHRGFAAPHHPPPRDQSLPRSSGRLARNRVTSTPQSRWEATQRPYVLSACCRLCSVNETVCELQSVLRIQRHLHVPLERIPALGHKNTGVYRKVVNPRLPASA
jgi:hypothetical protein